jgi:hypothetical protein
MSEYQNQGPLVSNEDLTRMGVQPLPDHPGVNLPSVEQHEYTVDDSDTQQCYFMSQHELAPLYIDNPVGATPVQPDAALEVDNEYVTLTYRGGGEDQVRIGDIELGGGGEPDRLVKWNGLVYPMVGDQVALNAHTTPRLAHMRSWLLDQVANESGERLTMAHLVATFATQIGRLGTAMDAVGGVSKGLPFDGYQFVQHRQ